MPVADKDFRQPAEEELPQKLFGGKRYDFFDATPVVVVPLEANSLSAEGSYPSGDSKS